MPILLDYLKDPKTHHPIYDLALPFSEYITACQHIIKSTRLDLKQDAEKIIEANSPFELRPEKSNNKGVLLIHGLLDSPFIMRDIAEKLQKQGYLVRAILLPGHGTIPGDLLNVHYSDWIQAARYGIASFENDVKEVYIGGFSTGANLGLYHALHKEKISGIFLLCPAIKIRSRLDFSCNWHHVISWAWERAKWLHVMPENDYAKYQSIPFNAAYQVYKLSRIIKKISKKHTPACPLLFIVSLADSTVSSKAAIKYFHKYFSLKNKMLIYSRNTNHENEPNTLVRSSVYPKLHIQEFSHIAIPISPGNPHYGKYGDYINASRVEESDKIIYGGFNKLENKIYDFLYKNNLVFLQRRRLSFNPDFEFMVEEIEKFLE